MASITNDLKYPDTQIPQLDPEKRGHEEEDIKAGDVNITTTSSSDPSVEHDIAPTPVLLRGRIARWNDKIEGLAGLEARGITRVLPEEKHGGGARGYLQMLALWFSINMTVLNIITGLTGPLLFSLGWTDSVCLSIFATGLSACGVSYTSTFGPQSGNRTMILGRFFMGYWPSKIACLLNIILQIGWGIIGCIVAGQMFSAINGKGLTIAVGCVIAALLIGGIATFGIAYIHVVERWASIPQLFAIFVLYGKTAKHFDTSSTFFGEAGTLTASRCSFFALEFASVIGFSAIGADFYVYYPSTTPKWITFAATWTGSWIALLICNLVGIGIATGVAVNASWSEAYTISSGALLLECYNGLGGFGSFCVVILALGCVTNNAPCTYAGALAIQVLGRYAKAIPRWIWCVFITLIELICSVAGRDHLFSIFENFLPIMSYWVVPWVTILVEEHLIFHKLRGVPFNWEAWEDKKQLPIGAAALFAWLAGWAGAIIGMSQVWYTGPVALRIGGYGGDIGAWLSVAFAGAIYPGLRYLELQKFGR
ncbi:MAG: hypothetical protein L6R40_006856 [Gallowayella cf. fulva]|nr:MAG: hypothetical protein L6R40_006856 [Xanthomendoza cf. fulva]